MKVVTKKIDADVEDALKRGEWKGEWFLLPPTLERKLYVRVNEALEVLGGKWSRKAKAHVFDADARKAMEDLLEAGEYVDETKSYDVFYTPAWLADELVQYLPWSVDQKPEARFLEPSSGEGALVGAIRRAFLRAPIVAVEVRDDPKLFGPLSTAARQSKIHTFHGKSFLDYIPDSPLVPVNKTPPTRGLGLFDAVVMNPPFSRGQALDHVQHAWQFLHDGGVLVAVMPRSAREEGSTKRRKAFAMWVSEVGGDWHDLPDDSFKASGTMVRTTVLVARK